jgi:hypothetical protein
VENRRNFETRKEEPRPLRGLSFRIGFFEHNQKVLSVTTHLFQRDWFLFLGFVM